MSNSFTNISELKYWCYKVLPLVYDDSLSYYEVLCKVSEKLNEVITNNNNIPEYIKELVASGGFLSGLQEQIAELNDGDSTTATADRYTGELIWLNGNLYRITRNMLAGDQYTESGTGITGNIEKITMEEWVNRYNSFIKDGITVNDEKYNSVSSSNYDANTLLWWYGKLYKATTDIGKNSTLSTDTNLTEVSIETELKNEATAREEADANLQTSITNETTAREEADANLQNSITNETTAREEADANLLAKIEGMPKSPSIATITAEELGIVSGNVNDDTRNLNSDKLNEALTSEEIVLFDQKDYEFGKTIEVQCYSGIIGRGTKTRLIIYNEANGILVPIKYNKDATNNVWTSITLTNFTMISGVFNSNINKGLYIQNYTYYVTCNGDHEKYVEYKGDGYGLELRNSDISYLYISGFASNVYIDGACTLANMHHIICTDGVIGIEDYSSDSLISNIYITFAQKYGLYMKGNLDAHYSNIKVYQNGKSSGATTSYAGVSLTELWGGQFVNLSSEENAGIGIYLVGCKGTVLNCVASSNGFAPLSSTDEYAYSGVALTDCEGIIGNILAIDKHGLYSSQEATQTYGFTSNKATSGKLNYYEIGNKKKITEGEWNYVCNLVPTNNTLNFDVIAADNITINNVTARYHDNTLEIYGDVSTTAEIPAGNWLLNLSNLNFNSLTPNIHNYSMTRSIVADTTGAVYPVNITPNSNVATLVSIPANRYILFMIRVPVSID